MDWWWGRGRGVKKHEIYTDAFGGHLLYDYSIFYCGGGGRGGGSWLPRHLDSLLVKTFQNNTTDQNLIISELRSQVFGLHITKLRMVGFSRLSVQRQN